MNEEKPLMVYVKVADKQRNRVIIPMPFIKKWGIYYSMEVYKDYIKLIPIKDVIEEREQ